MSHTHTPFFHHLIKPRQPIKREVKPRFVASARFCGVGAPTVAICKPPETRRCERVVGADAAAAVTQDFHHPDATDTNHLGTIKVMT